MYKYLTSIILILVGTLSIWGQNNQICENLLNEEFIVPFIEDDTIGLNNLNTIGEVFGCSNFLPVPVLLKRIETLAQAKLESGKAIVLTYGTNGSCGLGGLHDHITTEKFNFDYLCVGSSCMLGNIPILVKKYNDISSSFLDSININWRKDVNNALWYRYLSGKKFQRPQRELELVGLYEDERGNELELLVDSFYFEHRLDLGYGYSYGVWRLDSDTLKFYTNHDLELDPVQYIYYEAYIEDLLVKKKKLYRLNEDRTLQDKKVNSILSSKNRRRENFYRRTYD